jgi:hypothetical protein
MGSKSNPLAVFALGLKSTYEREHSITGLLSLADLVMDFLAFIFYSTYKAVLNMY